MSTPASLIARLRDAEDQHAWEEFVDLYTPMLLRWCRAQGMSDHDAADCIQETLTTLVNHMKEFEYDPNRSFRAWLKTVAVNHARDWHIRRQRIANTEAEAVTRTFVASDAEVFEQHEYRTYVIRQALRLIEQDFDQQTCDVFRQVMLDERTVQEVADEFQVTRNAVYLAKSRVMRRLREKLDRLLD